MPKYVHLYLTKHTQNNVECIKEKTCRWRRSTY